MMDASLLKYFLCIIFVIVFIWILIQKSIKEKYIPEKYKYDEYDYDCSIVTWNIQKFPWSLKSFKDDKIYNVIKSHSIILLQECFDETYESLESCFPDYYICRGNLKGMNIMNSGLVILSKFPIGDVVFNKYKNYNPLSFELFSEKGFLVANININKEKHIKVINTHLQSSDFERFDKNAILQLQELIEYMNILNYNNIPYIVGGDFNIDIKDFNNISNIRDIHYPSQPTIYINFLTSHTSNKIIKNYDPLIFDYFISKIKMEKPIVMSIDYSDHNPVKTQFFI